ncbi:MAG TPA: cupin domain-containing protein [Vicinamibacterales bacterium]|nr:cupin domain-containing protein [Vicinamibacterales bacterium]
MGKKTELSRRQMLQAAAAASFGSAIFAGAPVSAQAPKIQVGKDPGKHEPIPPFKYNIETSTGSWNGEAGSAREATMEEFPVSEHIAGVSMRLKPGGIRELHWHAIAAEWAYVIEGKVMGTVISPTGEPATDIFFPGDLWYFPKGHGHALQNVGNTDAHFILGFDDGHFSEYGTFSITDWVARSSPDVVARNLGLPKNVVAGLPTKEVYIIPGKIPSQIPEEYLGGEALQENQNPHKFSLAKAPLEQYKDGWIRRATQKEFPINSTLTSVLQYLNPGAIREMHWHPNADEWQYILEGRSRVTVFGAHGRTRSEECGPGDVVFIQQGFGHYVENIGGTPLRFFALFNSSTFEEISISGWLAGNPASLIADNFGIPKSDVAKLPKKALGFI